MLNLGKNIPAAVMFIIAVILLHLISANYSKGGAGAGAVPNATGIEGIKSWASMVVDDEVQLQEDEYFQMESEMARRILQGGGGSGINPLDPIKPFCSSKIYRNCIQPHRPYTRGCPYRTLCHKDT